MLRKRSGPAVVLVTHHVEEIVPGFTHALLLKNGRAANAGPLDSTLTTANLRAVFEAPIALRKIANRFRLSIASETNGFL